MISFYFVNLIEVSGMSKAISVKISSKEGIYMHFERDRYFLEMALEEAEKALKENTYPVGAVIVDGNNNVIARGRNRVHPQKT